MKLKILGIKPAVSKADKIYWKVQTNSGDMTAFDKEIIEQLTIAQEPDTIVNLNVVQTEKEGRTYQNIRGFAMDDDKGTMREKMEFFEHEDKQVIKPQEFGKESYPMKMVKTDAWKDYPKKPVKGSAYEKDPVGLAVEVFNALVEAKCFLKPKDNMAEAIDMVKQAQEAFI